MTDKSISAAASLEAFRVHAAVSTHGPDEAADVIRGRLAANLLGLSNIEGHSAALAYVNKVLRLYIVPEQGRKLELVVSNTAEVVG